MGLNPAGASRWPSRLAGLILIVLIVQLGWMTGTIGARMLSPTIHIAPLFAGGGGGATGTRPAPEISVSALNLFGSSGSTMEVPAAISENAPDTNLRLVLNGVAMARRAEHSSAIVAEGPGGEVSWYRVGDSLPGNAQLVEVQQDRILLRRAGRIETLRFALESDDGDGGLAAVSPAERLPQTTEEFVAEAQSRLAQDAIGTLAAVGFSPRDNSGSGGYVYDGSNPMLNSMSLRPGDVVLAVNGQALGDPAADQQLIQQWSQQQELQVEVERDGSRFSFVVPVP